MNIKEMTGILFLCLCAIYDWKTKEIPVLLITLSGLAAFILTIFPYRELEIIPFAYSLIPGAFLLILTLCTKESIGYGDGFVVLVLGMLMGFRECAITVFTAFIFSALFALFLLAVHKADRKSRLPFIPFLSLGLGVILVEKYFSI